MFTFIKYRAPKARFYLEISHFVLYDFLIVDHCFFEIPTKDAFIKMDDVTLENLVFKNAYFLGDLSSGFDKGN